ncbi:hypothetical protein PRIPAC_85463 [Pristionchus pacificus]|uniref:Uncharacterized protein n=1 Tax=Pristionchus pacificus TaxID=54126 RepID=A0A2A6BN75_PRIPA|nr:hypothetical protein PRIPAC_85463 [Pristionchus pacificus]|eukprot:PDM67288.1 hypothetical protein PRIPAC_48705 [Pristionchus pacificus]
MFAQTSSPLDICEGWRKKTNEIPHNERIRGMIMSSFAALKSMNGMDISDLEFHQATLRAEREIARKFDTKATMDPCRLFFYGFSECIEGLLSTVIERIGEIEAMNDGEKTDEAHSLPDAADTPAPQDPSENAAGAIPPPQARSLVDGEAQDPIRLEDRATSAPATGNSDAVTASTPSTTATANAQPIQTPPAVPESLGNGMVKMEDIDEEEDDSQPGDALMNQSHSGSDASHSVVKEEEMDEVNKHAAPPVVNQFRVGHPIAPVTMGQYQGGSLLQLAGMVRRPSQSFNGFDAPSTSSTSNVPSGSKTTAQKFLELPNQRLYYRAPRPTLHAVGKKLLKRDSTRPKFNKEMDNMKTLHCLFCHMRDMNLDEFVAHLLQGHNTTPSKSRLGFQCKCGFLGMNARAARLHKYSTRDMDVNAFVEHLNYAHNTTPCKCCNVALSVIKTGVD